MNAKRSIIEPIHNIGDINANYFGAKAAQLRTLVNIGVPTPPGFFISQDLVGEAIDFEEMKISKRFNNIQGLYALRASPGHRDWGSIDAILNLGMNDAFVNKIGAEIGKNVALDIYRRFIYNFSISVYGLEPTIFEKIYSEQVRSIDGDDECRLDEESLIALIELTKSSFKQEVGAHFPQSLKEQLDVAFQAMSRAWYRPSAKILRSTRGAPPDAGIGIVLQKMAIGIGPTLSGSGRATSIDSSTGEKKVTGYFLPNSQGNEAMNSYRKPHLLSERQRNDRDQIRPSLETMQPRLFDQIKNISNDIIMKFGEVFELEFTVDKNHLHVLDMVVAERSARASVRVAVDLVNCAALTEEQALLKVAPQNLIEFLHPQISDDFSREVVGYGLPASPGAVSGRVAFSSFSASAFNVKGDAAILVRVETSPEDIAGIHDSVGVLTIRGGMTSHAAVIARGLGLPCVVGVSTLTMNIAEKSMICDSGQKFLEGDLITLDGTLGEVLVGSADMTQPEISGAFSSLMAWADRYRALSVRGNADTPQEAQLARDFGADGIGLCRTEHMFFEKERLLVMREMILAESDVKRREALNKLLPMQRDDFIKFFQIMKGQPVTIRLLDPPLHEFLPNSEDEMRMLAEAINEPFDKIKERSKDLEEFNPMLGKRGVRLGISLPEIYEMQVRAIFEAAFNVNKEGQSVIKPEIMIPLVSTEREVDYISNCINEISEEINAKMDCEIEFKLGAVLETPRAALKANDLSVKCDFLSFGTNDLTQMTYGLSRDDAGRFMTNYIEKDVFPNDPFHSLDLEGVGELILIAVDRARKSDQSTELGLCGEHGGDPDSIKFCLEAGFNYVSCSPFRIPIARLAAAQASILRKKI